MKHIAALAVLLAAMTTPASAQRFNPRMAQRPNWSNRSGGYCEWAAMTTLLRGHGRTGLDLVKDARRRGVGGPARTSDVSRRLTQLGVPHRYQAPGTKGSRPFPFVGTFRWGEESTGYHAVVVLGNDGRHVRYIDPNYPGRTMRMRSGDFWPRWQGNAISMGRAHVPSRRGPR